MRQALLRGFCGTDCSDNESLLLEQWIAGT